MSLLGKIFAILNILGVGGFLYMASLDYAKRESWAYAVFRQDLLIHGLPLDKSDVTAEGQPVVDLLNEETRKALLPQGPAVTTQEEEVARYRTDVNKDLDEVKARLQGVPEIRQALFGHAALLLPFAQTASERELLLADQAFFESKEKSDALNKAVEQAWKDANRTPAAGEAKPELRDAFEESLVGQRKELALPFVAGLLDAHKANSSEKDILKLLDISLEAQRQQLVAGLDGLFRDVGPRPDQSPDQRRRAIARLLFNLTGPLYGKNQDQAADPAYDRFLNVVGLESAVPAAYDAARDLAEVARQVDAQRTRERGHFAAKHHALLRRIEELAAQVEADRGLYARKQQQQAGHEEELKKRRREVADYENELAELRRVTAEQIHGLQAMTGALFQERVKLRNATEDNQKLEKQIRALEAGR